MHSTIFGRNSRSKTAFALLAIVASIVIETAPRAAVRPPKLDYKMTTLDNGLKVVLLEDHSTPIVHTELWYHVGSKNEKKGRTGFAHLFEHMMFKGSKNVEPEGHPSRISSVGGQSNASTNEDATIFWETTPAQYLPMVLWLEADRMATLRIDEKVFATEREVVKEERRMRVENQPYGKLNEIIYDQAFTTHPYKHPTIGSMADLEAASIDDVRDFFKTYYVPENATLVLVGDFDAKEALELVKRYLGRVPKSNRPVPRDIPAEPAQTKERRVRVDENVPLPAVVVAHHITFDGHPDSYPLHIASKVLSDGQSSRIYRKLVYEQQLALAAFGQGNIIEDPNLFFAVAIVQRGRRPGRGHQGAHRRARSAEDRADQRRRAAAGQEPVRARLHPQPGIEQGQGPAAGARGRHPRRHHDRRRRVRHLHEHHGRRRAARGAEILHAGEPAGAHPHAEGLGQRQGAAAVILRTRTVTIARSCRRPRPGASRRRPGSGSGLALGAAPRPLAGPRRQVSAVPGQDALEWAAGHRGVAPRAAGRQPAADHPRRRSAGPERQGWAWRPSSPPLLDQGTTPKDAEQIATSIDSIGGSSAPAPAAT